MSQVSRDLERCLAAAGVEASALAPLVIDMSAARAEAINREGLRSQVEYLLETYGPGEIEAIALRASGGAR
jgi:hypothetical protein